MEAFTLLTDFYNRVRVAVRSATALDAVAVVAVIWALRGIILTARRKFKTTRLRGPPRTNLLYGVSKHLLESSDAGSIDFEHWAEVYGPAYEIPTFLGGSRIVLCNPRAIAHYCAREAWTYVRLPSVQRLIQRHMGGGLLWAEGEVHKNQRKSMAPAFGPSAIRSLMPVFHNSAYKTKAAWESLIDQHADNSAVIEVQQWMNHISLDSIGLAGFSHDFGSLDGKPASVTKVFDTFASSSKRSNISVKIALLTEALPILLHVPTPRMTLLIEMQEILAGISNTLIEKAKNEKERGVLEGKEDKSIIGVLIKAHDEDSRVHLTREQVVAQMKVLFIAGYEATSTSLTWALIEMARNPSIQSKLREELLTFGADPTFDQLNNSLPYLDAMVNETLRVHPPVLEITRVAKEDDVIPLSEPVRTMSGDVVDSIAVARGTQICIPIACINRSTAIWGADAKVFSPERWLDESTIPEKAQEVQGYRHLLSFIDGTRTCLGKLFAVVELKVVLSVLVKNFVFEMRDGPETRIEIGMGIIRRPKIAGEEGAQVPLRVRRYDG